MKLFIAKNKKIIATAVCCLLIAGITMSFYPLQFGPIQHYDSLLAAEDTVPVKKLKGEKMTMKEYDEMVSNLDVEMRKALAGVKSINADKLTKEIAASLKELDADKIKMEIATAMKEVDFAALQKQLKEAMLEIDCAKMSDEVRHSLDKAKKEMENINMDLINEQIEKAKAEMENCKSAIEKIDFDKIMKAAREDIDKAKQTLQLQKEMFTEMEKDGLIHSKDGFIIEYKNKSLFINGKKQSDSISGKYRRYIPGDEYEIKIDKE